NRDNGVGTSVADEDKSCDDGVGAFCSQSETLNNDHTSFFDPPFPHDDSQRSSTSFASYIDMTGIRAVKMPDFSHISPARSELERRTRRQGRDCWRMVERQFAFSLDSLMAQKGARFCMDYGLDKVTPDTFTTLPVDENVERRTADEYERSINLCREAVGRAKRAAESLEDDDSEECIPMDRKGKKARVSDISSVSSGSSQSVNSVRPVSAVREKKPVVGNNFWKLRPFVSGSERCFSCNKAHRWDECPNNPNRRIIR
ncbi:hypothetical protein BGZ76_004390, partial [Entomortierella beljakovae]